MKASFYPRVGCWRVQYKDEAGSRRSKYFKTQAEAEAFIAKLTGSPISTQSVSVPTGDAVFWEEAAAELGSRDEIRKAIAHYKRTVLAIRKNVSVLEMCEDFIRHQESQGFSPRTLADDRYRLRRFAEKFENLKSTELSTNQIEAWLGTWKVGSNRRNFFKISRKLLIWGKRNGYLLENPIENTPAPRAESSKGIMRITDYARILRACAGIDLLPSLPTRFKPRAGIGVVENFARVLPVFVLGGMAGLRTSEMVRAYGTEQIIHWEDINWNKGWIHVRHGVAKKTRRDNDERFIPLEPAVNEWLKPAAKLSGPVCELSDATYRELSRQLRARLRVTIPRNGLRNSYASYAQSFRGTAEVAKAMGDLEETARRHYMQTLEPESGRVWFDIAPSGRPTNIIAAAAVA